tara:strand:+ start:874 stop:1203 length:330 start_codon:yes stop_codon:yes gene_type:complete
MTTTSSQWRQEVELMQNFSKHKTFTYTTSSADAETILTIAGNMQEGNKLSLVVELGDAYIEFDGTATTSSMLIPQDEGYFDDGIYIGSHISVIRATSTNVRFRGIIWGR